MGISPVGDAPVCIDNETVIRQKDERTWADSPGIRSPHWEGQMDAQVSSQIDVSLLVQCEKASARETSKSTPPSSSILSWSWTTANFILISMMKRFLLSSPTAPARVLIPGCSLLWAVPIWKALVASEVEHQQGPSWNCKIFHSAGKPFFLPSSNKEQVIEK